MVFHFGEEHIKIVRVIISPWLVQWGILMLLLPRVYCCKKTITRRLYNSKENEKFWLWLFLLMTMTNKEVVLMLKTWQKNEEQSKARVAIDAFLKIYNSFFFRLVTIFEKCYTNLNNVILTHSRFSFRYKHSLFQRYKTHKINFIIHTLLGYHLNINKPPSHIMWTTVIFIDSLHYPHKTTFSIYSMI